MAVPSGWRRPGAAGVIGQDTAAKAQADGYTLLFAGNTILVADRWC
jgi:hypothetical protein